MFLPWELICLLLIHEIYYQSFTIPKARLNFSTITCNNNTTQGLFCISGVYFINSLFCVIVQARGLLNEYRCRPVIPCTLHGLCSQCGQGMWDSGHVPTVQCVGSHLHGECPYLASPHPSPDLE